VVSVRLVVGSLGISIGHSKVLLWIFTANLAAKMFVSMGYPYAGLLINATRAQILVAAINECAPGIFLFLSALVAATSSPLPVVPA